MKELLSARMVETDAGEVEFDITPPNPPGNHLDVLMQLLARQRQEAQPPVPEEMPFSMSDVPVATLGHWFVGDSFEHRNVLGLRHPALGWVVFALPTNFQEELAAQLQKLAQRQSERPSTTQ